MSSESSGHFFAFSAQERHKFSHPQEIMLKSFFCLQLLHGNFNDSLRPRRYSIFWIASGSLSSTSVLYSLSECFSSRLDYFLLTAFSSALWLKAHLAPFLHFPWRKNLHVSIALPFPSITQIKIIFTIAENYLSIQWNLRVLFPIFE